MLFPNPAGDGPINPHAPTKALSRARPALGIADFRIHDLRRTAATRMAELGINPHTISMILNHVSARGGHDHEQGLRAIQLRQGEARGA